MTDDTKLMERPAVGKPADDATEATGKRAAKSVEATTEKAFDQAEMMADAASGAARRIAEDGAAFSLKMIALAELNLHQAFEAMRAAATAKDASEVMRIHGDYLRDQGARSIEQVREIGEMIADYGRSTMSQLTERA